MSVTNGYTTTATLKSGYRIDDADDDEDIALAIEAASRAIDGACNRRFYLDSATSARTYIAPYTYAPGVVELRGKMWHDFDPSTAPTVKVDVDNDGTFETTWTAGTDYQLEPLTYAEMESEPQNQLRLLGAQYLRASWQGRPNLQVTAKWGWPAVPVAIAKATAILAVDYWRAKDAPFGIGGTTDYGVFRIRDNPIVKSLIDPYRLPQGIC